MQYPKVKRGEICHSPRRSDHHKELVAGLPMLGVVQGPCCPWILPVLCGYDSPIHKEHEHISVASELLIEEDLGDGELG
jgi:hypothetical protein